MNKIAAFLTKYRRFIPLAATALLALIAYLVGAILYPGMRNLQVFTEHLQEYPHHDQRSGAALISLEDRPFVSGIMALVSVSVAPFAPAWIHGWLFLLMMLMGSALGAVMGSFVAYLKVQPFIATLAGMWFARGMCFFIR